MGRPHYIIAADKVDWEATCCSYSFFTGQNISENENISQRERKDIFLDPIFFSVNKKPLKFNWHDPDKYIFQPAEIWLTTTESLWQAHSTLFLWDIWRPEIMCKDRNKIWWQEITCWDIWWPEIICWDIWWLEIICKDINNIWWPEIICEIFDDQR